MNEFVAILDFGGQYKQLIARRVRECNVYCEILPYTTSLEALTARNPKGIILTGGLLRFPEIEQEIRRRCGFIADVFVYPSEFELETMANAALSVLRGEVVPLTYTGEPVFSGFSFESR